MRRGEEILQDSYESDNEDEAADVQPGESQASPDYKPKYNDYSWLYESDADKDKDAPPDLSLKDQKEKDELKSLIDEVIE